MNITDTYIIQFSGLAEGKNSFDYVLDNVFFDVFDYKDSKDSNIEVNLELHKQQNMMILDFSFNGYMTFECDRCLEDYKQHISGKERLLVKFGENPTEENDEVIILSPADHQINISKFIYDSIILLLPYRKIHPEDEHGKSNCKPLFIEQLNKLSTHNNSDPRWESLKQYIKK